MRDIIVCGHSHCGAMKGLLDPSIAEDVPAVAARLARKQVALHGWVYNIETGEVLAYEPSAGQFNVVREAHGAPDFTPLNRLATIFI